MSGKRYPEELKIQAAKQVVDKGYTMKDVAKRLSVTYKSLYDWVQKSRVIGWTMKSSPKTDLSLDALLMAVWRGNCHNNAVAESFSSLLKKDRVKRKIYKKRDDARSQIFDYIEGPYNPRPNYGTNNGLSPEEMEKQYFMNPQGV
jgi:hypothetical protein